MTSRSGTGCRISTPTTESTSPPCSAARKAEPGTSQAARPLSLLHKAPAANNERFSGGIFAYWLNRKGLAENQRFFRKRQIPVAPWARMRYSKNRYSSLKMPAGQGAIPLVRPPCRRNTRRITGAFHAERRAKPAGRRAGLCIQVLIKTDKARYPYGIYQRSGPVLPAGFGGAVL